MQPVTVNPRPRVQLVGFYWSRKWTRERIWCQNSKSKSSKSGLKFRQKSQARLKY